MPWRRLQEILVFTEEIEICPEFGRQITTRRLNPRPFDCSMTPARLGEAAQRRSARACTAAGKLPTGTHTLPESPACPRPADREQLHGRALAIRELEMRSQFPLRLQKPFTPSPSPPRGLSQNFGPQEGIVSGS